MYSSVIQKYFWWSVSSHFLAHWFHWIFCYYWLLRVLYICWVQAFIRYMFCKYILPVSDLPFNFLNSILQRAKVLKFEEAQFIIFLLRFFLFCSLSKESCLIKSFKYLLFYIFYSLIINIMVILCKLIFIYGVR